MKRATDVILAALMLAVCSPLFLLIALLIKLEGLLNVEGKGPVFYREMRITEGRPFAFYKFRFIKQRILDEEKVVRRRDRAKALEQDQYCTAVGRRLKKSYLDELPQLYNILRGDMSLVGPRPFPVGDYEDDLRKGDFRKKVIRAGLTGLVQIHKGMDIGKDDVELDNEYIQKCRALGAFRFWFYDLGIMLKTIRVILQAKGL